MAGDTVPTLTPDEENTYDRCLELKHEVIAKVFGEDGYENKGNTLIEHRMFWRPWTTAKVDGMGWIPGDKRLLIWDFKCGRNDVTHADANIQLRTAAALAWLNDINRDCEEIFVAIIQPFASPPISIARYSIGALDMATYQIADIVMTAQRDGAKRIPGEKQCMYCRAKGVCPELHHKALTPSRQIPHLNSDLATLPTKEVKARVEAFVHAMPDGQLAVDMADVKLCEIACESIKNEMKARLKEGREIEGWKLATPKTLAPITDVPTVVARLAERGVSREEAILMLKMSKEVVEAMLRSKTGLKGKALEAEMEVVLKDCTTEATCEPSLVRVK